MCVSFPCARAYGAHSLTQKILYSRLRAQTCVLILHAKRVCAWTRERVNSKQREKKKEKQHEQNTLVAAAHSKNKKKMCRYTELLYVKRICLWHLTRTETLMLICCTRCCGTGCCAFLLATPQPPTTHATHTHTTQSIFDKIPIYLYCSHWLCGVCSGNERAGDAACARATGPVFLCGLKNMCPTCARSRPMLAQQLYYHTDTHKRSAQTQQQPSHHTYTHTETHSPAEACALRSTDRTVRTQTARNA